MESNSNVEGMPLDENIQFSKEFYHFEQDDLKWLDCLKEHGVCVIKNVLNDE